MVKEYKTIARIAGPLVFVEKTHEIAYGELVSIDLGNGVIKNGQVLDTSKEIVVVQVFEGTAGIDIKSTVKFAGQTIKLGVSKDLLGRVLSGLGKPLDGWPEIIAEEKWEITGAAINPCSRESPKDFVQTGISTIDGMNTLVKGQKLPIFSGAGLPHNAMALQIARQANIAGGNFAVVFAAMGITNEEAQQFIQDFEQTGALERTVVFLNLASDPAIERLITPKMALTAAEYLAFKREMDVLVILTDMTNYCDALREIGAAREEVPGRRGYPGYMYSVDGSRRVVVKDPQGNLQIVKFCDLFTKLSKTNGISVTAGDSIERILTPGWEALSADCFGNSEFKPLKQLLRHGYAGKLLKITTQAGETIVTPNHSIFSVVNGVVEPVLSQELRVGDLLAHVNKIPALVSAEKFNLATATLSGYYVSEGHSIKYLDKKKNVWCHYVKIDNNDKEFAIDVREKFNEVFGKYPSTFVSDKRSGTIRSSLGGKQYYNTLVNELECGINSNTKRIPHQIFTASHDVQKAFLEAYYLGDGKAQDPRYITKQYDMVTVSEGLRDDLMVLSKVLFPDRIPTFYKWKDRNAWKVYLSTYLKCKSEKVNDVIGVEIKKIEWVEPTESYVYDLSVQDNQNFVDACGGVLLHNTDLASIYERAGIIKGKKGSVTQFPILTMPGDDITHPIPDLTGYITEGQIVLGRDLHMKGIYPPVDVLPCLSRLMNLGIGAKSTREDHKAVSNQMYAGYAEGRSLRGLVAIVGEEAMSERDIKFLRFADAFEDKFIRQGKHENRTIFQTLDLGWKLLELLPRNELTRIEEKMIEKYLGKIPEARTNQALNVGQIDDETEIVLAKTSVPAAKSGGVTAVAKEVESIPSKKSGQIGKNKSQVRKNKPDSKKNGKSNGKKLN